MVPCEDSALAKSWEIAIKARLILEDTVLWTEEGSGRTKVHMRPSLVISLFALQPLTSRDFSVSLLEGQGSGDSGL